MKSINPKDAIGSTKPPITTVPMNVMSELGVAMMEGSIKYGKHNYRVSPVRASVYVDAAWRHLSKWWEGEDIDPDSELSHVIKAIASLTVIRDAMMQDSWCDDRPVKAKPYTEELQAQTDAVVKKYPVSVPPCLEIDNETENSNEYR